MGSAASLDALPETLSKDQVIQICGKSFNELEFDALADGGNSITKEDFLGALSNKTDVFLTHDWGKELGQDNHARVAEINRRLQERGLVTWFDSEQMEGNVKKQMAMGIDNAQCIIAFITKRYIDKVGGLNAEDNCQLEFNYAARRKTASKMIPVVMEERVRNTGTWDSEVGLVLGGRLYVDICGDVYDDVYMDNCIDDLYDKILRIIKTPIKGISGEKKTAPKHIDAEPTQSRPKTTAPRKDVKPLRELTVDEVSKLLEANKLGKFVDEMRENDTDGETLCEVSSDEDLQQLGISIAVKARMLYKKVEEYKYNGVPLSLLGAGGTSSSSETVPTKYGDGKFTISGTTGKYADRVNGTYEISEEMQNGLPVYSKVGDSDTFVELVHGAPGWRWYIKNAANRGPNSSICFGYYQCDEDDMKLPSQCFDNKQWHMYSGSKFTPQDTVKITPSSTLPLPQNIAQLLSQARTSIKAAKEAALAEAKRDPLPGAFSISGATGKNANRINGIFEPTSETQNKFPVYKKKGDDFTWVEMVYSPKLGWRWYLKPVVNKGPDSSICFAYYQCQETDIKLPQDCPSWYCNVDEGFVQQKTTVGLASQQPLPSDVETRFNDGLRSAQKERDERIAQDKRGVIAGTFRISGATGKSEGRVNGDYEPSDEVQNSFPVYKKKGDTDTWIELVVGPSGWRWYLKPTANKGPDSSICFAYFQCDENDVKLPSECKEPWYVHTANGFVSQEVKITSESSLPLPQKITTLVEQGRAMIRKQTQERYEEELRGAAAGSFRIEGATGKNYIRVNGTFEPTSETQNGFPVYKKKGDDETWVEVVNGASGWRWYLKPKVNKGPDSTLCFAYSQLDEDNVKLPGDCSSWYVSTNEGFVVQGTIKVTRPSGADPPDVLSRFEDGKAYVLKTKNERIAEEKRDAKPGSFHLTGATGTCAARVNGAYEPTQEVQNGMPVYQKKGNNDTWVEMVHGATWRWYVKATANKGPSSSICFAYYDLGKSADDCKLPCDCTAKNWIINTSEGFKGQNSIKVSSLGGSEQPEFVKNLLTAAKWKS